MNKTTGSNPVRPRENAKINIFDELYRPRNFIRFYSIKSKNEANLTRLNMFKVDRAISSYIGPFEKISEDYGNKTWTIEVRNETQGAKLKEMKELLSEQIEVTPHEHHNQSQGVITCAVLKGYEDSDITEGLKEQGVTNCKRIIRNPKSSNPEPTTTLILTFNVPYPPDRITIRTGLSERVRPYIPIPRRCFNCQKYGHSGAKCRKETPVCTRCGLDFDEEHKAETCDNPVNCIHCNQPHSVASKTCPKYLNEKEILTIKTKEHLTFAEARAKVNANKPPKSYAKVTATGPKPSINTHRLEIDGNNNQTQPNESKEIRSSSARRAKIRTHSSSTERHDREEHNKSRKIQKQKHSKPIQHHSQNDSNSMEVTVPPDPGVESLEPRARDYTPNTYNRKQNEIMNNRRKLSKEREKPERDRSRQSRSVTKE